MDFQAVAGSRPVNLWKMYDKIIKLLQNEDQSFQPNEAYHQTNRLTFKPPLLFVYYQNLERQR